MTKQSLKASTLETLTNTFSGLGLSLAAQALFWPWALGVPVPHSANFAFAAIMTVVSLARGFIVRRLFEHLHIRVPMSAFIVAVLAERARQQAAEGYTLEHDDKECAPGDLVQAGGSYAVHAAAILKNYRTVLARWYCDDEHGAPPFWPWSTDVFKPTPKDFRRQAVKAAALMIAGGEQFDRMARRKS